MTSLHAALAIHQLARVTYGAKRQQETRARYDEAFADLPVVRPAPIEEGIVHARHLYTILLKTRDTFGYKRGDFPNAEYISDRTLSLPLSSKLSDADVEDVVSAIRHVVLDLR